MSVLLDSSLTLDSHVLLVARSAFAQLKLVHQLRLFLEMLDLTTVAHAFVTSCLGYCNMLYVGLPLKTVQKFQLVQNLGSQTPDWGQLQGAYNTPVTRTALATSLFLGPIQSAGYYL